MRKVFHFFRQNAKSVLLFSIKCEKCLNFFYKLLKVCEVFDKMQKPLGNFLFVYNFSSVFPNMCAKLIRVSLHICEFGALN